MPKNKVTVKINGIEYILTGDESEGYLFSIAHYIDKKIKETLAINPKHNNSSAAVLAALTVTDELFKLKKSIEEPQEKLKKLKLEYDNLYDSYMRVSKEYEEYKIKQQGIGEDIDTLKNQYEELYESFVSKNEELQNIEKENDYLKQQNDMLQVELEKARSEISNLKDQLLESQIELVKVKKELKDLQSKKRG